MIMACFIVSAFEPTDVAKALATSFAPRNNEEEYEQCTDSKCRKEGYNTASNGNPVVLSKRSHIQCLQKHEK